MIGAIILLILAATPALSDGRDNYSTALQTADHEAQAEHDALAPVYVGLGSDHGTGSSHVVFYRSGSEIPNVVAEIVAISLGDLLYIHPLAVGPHIVYFDMASGASVS